MRIGVWALIALSMPFAGAAEIHYAGRPVVEVLEELRGQGVGLVYSTQLVPNTLRVLREPKAHTSPEDLLTEILAPHGLGISRIADNQYVVVTLRNQDIPDATVPRTGQSHDAEEVVVTSSRYALVDESPGSHTFLTQRQVENLPRLGDETLRAVQRLPGVASNGFSALGRIRGGEENETQIVLNGLALYEPFHLKNFLGPISVLDSRLIENIEVYTGGFTAEYGNRMSAVIDAETLSSTDRHELGLSLFHLSGLTGGSFSGGDGSFLVALRRSTLDELAHFSEADFGEPAYSDGFAQVGYSITDKTRFTLNALGSHDAITAVRSSGSERAKADYRNSYVWGELRHDWSARLQSRWLTSLTNVDNDRTGEADDPAGGSASVTDARSYRVFGLKFATDYAGERIQQRWGLEARWLESDYRYSSSVGRDIDLQPAGWQYGVYASARFRPLRRLTAEAGLRWDRQTYTRTAQAMRAADDQLSPRLNLMYELNDGTRLRGSWGRFFQPQDIDELQVEDGVERFFGAQRADHIIVSLERDLSRFMQLRIEAYRKDYSRLRLRYENLFDALVLLPELQADRIRIAPDAAHVRAVEILLQARDVSAWNWWLSYTRSSAIDVIDGADVRRSWDQPHGVQAGLGRSGRFWDWTAAASWHSGWPRTGLYPVEPTGLSGFAIGPRNAARFNDFASLDLRVTRRIPLPRGELLVSGELTNALNRKNECCVRYSVELLDNGLMRLDEERRHWLPLVPSVGVLWKF